MKTRSRQRTGEAPASTAVEPGTRAVAREHRRMAWFLIAGAVVAGALLLLALTVRSGGTSAVRTTAPVPARGSSADTVPSDRLGTAVGWIDGLAAGLILPSDITSRLEAADPRLAEAVMAAWSDLERMTTSD